MVKDIKNIFRVENFEREENGIKNDLFMNKNLIIPVRKQLKGDCRERFLLILIKITIVVSKSRNDQAYLNNFAYLFLFLHL